MYSDWTSLTPFLIANSSGEENQSVLGKFAGGVGRDVALHILKHLASNLGITQAAEPSSLNTDQDVIWCMEVICYGLSLPLTEQDTIRDCVNVYCEWLTALHPNPKLSVPRPVCEDANLYARKIISHFHNLFVPRVGEGPDIINRQAILCHRVLRTLQHMAQLSTTMNKDTWEALLLFLLAINEVLLSPPTVKDDVGDQLCERVLSVLFEVWLLACVRCFPSPSLWKTLQESCLHWRHRIALIEQWNRVNLALTARLLEFTFGPTFPELKILDEDAQLIPAGMSNDCIAQSWFRFIHTIGSPISLCRPQDISNTPQFLQYAISSDSVIEPCQHPCLQALPAIFLKAIKGVAGQVDAFLGIAQPYNWEDVEMRMSVSAGATGAEGRSSITSGSKDAPQHSPTPPTQRRLAKSFSVTSSQPKGMPKTSLIGLTSSRTTSIPSASNPNSGPSSTSSLTSILSVGHDVRLPLAAARPRCNSILHLFGEWLFEAAHIGSDSWMQTNKKQSAEASKRPSSMLMETRKGSVTLSQPNSLNDSVELPSYLTIDKYESGRAEAIGALSRIFCAKKTGEEILPVYLARFYLALQQGLAVNESKECGETLASILVNSGDLFKLDLDGVQVLIPSVISALEVVLPEKELKLKSNAVNKTDLRRASIHLLISMLVIPLHFQNLPIKELTVNSDRIVTFAQLKPRLMNLLINALQVETDAQNTHMLLGGLLLSVQDSAAAEEAECVTQSDQSHDTTNLLSSACSDSVCSVGSTGGSTTNHSNECRSLTGSEELNSDLHFDGSTVYDSAHALFVRATYLVCHRLISTWKMDLHVSLAALELLSGLARMNIKESDALECKRAVKWVCDYICSQCSRPPPAHSKDLHSSIVSAFQCLSAWLGHNNHHGLLQDKECLHTVMEVVELGISGTKSVGKPGEPVKMKDEKELKPVSMRVRDAAENLLTVILEQVGYFPSECGAQSLSSLLDEVSLLKHCISWPNKSTDSQNLRDLAIKRFRYFVIENSTVLALLEERLGNDQDPQPTVTVLIRGPFGRHAWTMQLRHLPRSKSGSKPNSSNPGRPVPMSDLTIKIESEQKFFPDSVDRIPQCIADQSIPLLESLPEHSLPSTLAVSGLLESQTVHEKLCWANTVGSEQGLGHASECTQPTVCHEFQTARLFLSHFGFLNDDSNGKNTAAPLLTYLDTSHPSFGAELLQLDMMSPRTCDTVHVFYVKAGQKAPIEIVNNVQSSSSVAPHFLEMLLSLGWPVEVSKHAGWTGHASTSWKIQENDQQYHIDPDHGGSIYNGESHVLYWADVSSEMAFVVPTNNPQVYSSYGEHNVDGQCYSSTETSHSSCYERSVSQPQKSPFMQYSNQSRTLSLDFDKNNPEPIAPQRRRTGICLKPVHQTSMKILLVWLESYEDHLTFPTDELLSYTTTGLEPGGLPMRSQDCLIIFLHALNSGLLRVHLQGPAIRMSLATPLVDGMVVSRRALGALVRQTALNMARRRRLDNDTYQPPHVRRRLKVQELVQKYKKELTEPELLTHLFCNTT